jgi:hypothetical protein
MGRRMHMGNEIVRAEQQNVAHNTYHLLRIGLARRHGADLVPVVFRRIA